jgi:wyosine [tRNA(Phe)-imidazoG37] synthetase (radical SAM superfamily)
MPPLSSNSVIADVLTPALVTVKILLVAVSEATFSDINRPTEVKLLPVIVDANDDP